MDSCTCTWYTSGEEETRALAERMGRGLRGGEVFALVGSLGAGKTVFASGLMRGAGAPGPFRSPSFTLVWQHRGRFPIYHVDLYRLEGSDVWEDLPWDAIIAPPAVAVVEWADKLPSEMLPPDRVRVRLRRLDDGVCRRRIDCTGRGACVDLLRAMTGGDSE
ncbi:MAG: tRNA (adenosine(37)-N6)-threonylcarbamoyltransferase complex ATPase subunit type 1 TsaE [Bacillota bacterium]